MRKYIIGILLLTGNFVLAQKTISPKGNWQNLDLKKDGVFGMSTEKAYTELLKNRTGVFVPVAIIDGGVDIEHEDLKGAIWTNKNEIPNNKIDDDHNGYVDDIHGWNFMGSGKGSFHFDNIDLVRELRKEIMKDPNSTKTKELQHQLDDKRVPLESGLTVVERQRKILNNISKQIGKKYPDIKEFENYKYNNAEEEDVLIMVIKGLKEYPDYRRKFEEEYNLYKDQLNYWSNINYDPRAGNSEFEGRYYGNGDVKGLLPVHGTHVAGIIAANRNNGLGVKGVAAQALIMPLLAIPEGDALDKDEANAIRYAVDNGAKVINISAGKASSPDRAVVDSAVQYAMNKDVLIVHAAGNAGMDVEVSTVFPCRQYLSGGEAGAWIEVAASGFIDDKTIVPWFSNYGGKTVDVFAPGLQIKSTWWPEKYSTENGTSMAAPMVSGLAALIRSYYPKLSALQVKNIIMNSVIKREILKDKCISGGVVNVYEALKLAGTYY
ncbi:subtilisin family serine protease [Pedobacter cryoconitis]|uniref:Subtilisin family serine protease n=1 Tax=Pedobacter cryoconitis TaxID=188932 RepID=A0A7W8ZPJ4_9SPHI|nr:S8 family serine peptidase [Pedobacter cryoconitis]MBB5637833.1 subtilisin family serine protease [Pedobacter cryoconitis]MBB6270411.1 subtilisin family serine protease [Pedobacter cryoconitis]